MQDKIPCKIDDEKEKPHTAQNIQKLCENSIVNVSNKSVKRIYLTIYKQVLIIRKHSSCRN